MRKIILIIIFSIICYSNILAASCTLTTSCEDEQFNYRFCQQGVGFVYKCTSNPYNEDGLTPLKLNNNCINYYPDTYQIQYKTVYSYITVYDTTYNDIYDWEQVGTDPDTGDPIYDSVYVRTDTTLTPHTVCNDSSEVSWNENLAYNSTTGTVFKTSSVQSLLSSAISAWTGSCDGCDLNNTNIQSCCVSVMWSQNKELFKTNKPDDYISSFCQIYIKNKDCSFICDSLKIFLDQSDAFTKPDDSPYQYDGSFFTTEGIGEAGWNSLKAELECNLGAIFGFAGASHNSSCTNSGSIMNGSNMVNPNRGLSDDDKCMYKKLYCWVPKVTDVKESKEEIITEINVFPNPVQDNLTISNNIKYYNYNIEIYNIYGQKVLECPYANIIDVKKLTTGVYYLRINNDIIKFGKM